MPPRMMTPPNPVTAVYDSLTTDLDAGRAIDLRELTELTYIQLTFTNPWTSGATVLVWNPDTQLAEIVERDGVATSPTWRVSAGDWAVTGEFIRTPGYSIIGAQTRDEYDQGHVPPYWHRLVIRAGYCLTLYGLRGSGRKCTAGRILLGHWPIRDILVGHDAIRAARAKP